MPSRKQRRRRQKERRHDYELVYVDEEGHELEVDPAELRREKPVDGGRGQNTKKQPATGRRPPRVMQPPSWNRVLKRAALFFPVFFLLFSVVNKNASFAARGATALLYTLLFIPFMYLMDRTAYRTYLRRTGATPPPRRR
jgi:hypothetical protein